MKVNFTRVEFDGSVICVFGTYPQIAGEYRILTIPVQKDERTETLIARFTTEAVEDLVNFINENLGVVNGLHAEPATEDQSSLHFSDAGPV